MSEQTGSALPTDQNIVSVEFAVGIDGENGLSLWSCSIKPDASSELVGMLQATIGKLPADVESLPTFNPAEKLESFEILRLRDPMRSAPRAAVCFTTVGIPEASNILEAIQTATFYFARFEFQSGEKVVGVKRATGLKRIGTKNALLTIFDDELLVHSSPVFVLDECFDFLVFESMVIILHPKQFAFACNMQEVLTRASPANAQYVADGLVGFDLNNMVGVAQRQMRVTYLLASIKEDGLMENLSVSKLLTRCDTCGVPVTKGPNGYQVGDDQLQTFLEIIDRRRYQADLTTSGPEEWLAAARKQA